MSKANVLWYDIGSALVARPRREIALVSLAAVFLVGYLDYVTGIAVSFSVLYVLPIGLAAWKLGRGFAYGLTLLSIFVWVAGDAAKGVPPFLAGAVVWNACIRLLFYVIFVMVLCRLRDLQRDLGRHVEERTAALRSEMAERARLEAALMDAGERERRRIGQDLHDSLCQHLTGTALMGEALCSRLDARGAPEIKDARKVVDLMEEGIQLARSLAKGLLPVAEGADGLMGALEEFAATTSRAFRVDCRFECESPVLIRSSGVATHIFRIAQEAVSNAIKHGPASRITILLDISDKDLRLCVSDNGPGFDDSERGTGLGLNIMADRAKLIGGVLTVDTRPGAGTRITCMVPYGRGDV